MITRQTCYEQLFKLKNLGEDVSDQVKLLTQSKDIPKEVIEFLIDKSAQFYFFRYIQKYQKALMKSILNYEELDNTSKIKVLSSFITRAMISIEYSNIPSELIDDLELEKLSNAMTKAFSSNDYSQVDDVLKFLKESMLLFVSKSK